MYYWYVTLKIHVLKCKALSKWEMFGNRTWSNIAWLSNLLMLNWMILSMWLSVCFLKCLIPFSATSSMFDHRFNILQILSNMVQSDKTWSNKVSKQVSKAGYPTQPYPTSYPTLYNCGALNPPTPIENLNEFLLYMKPFTCREWFFCHSILIFRSGYIFPWF